MKSLLISTLLTFFAFASSAQGGQKNNYSSSQNTSQNNIENDIIRAINKGDCKKAKFLLFTNGITTGSAYESYQNCKPKPKPGQTSDALEFNPKTDDLSPLPSILQPIGDKNVASGNNAFKKGDFETALKYYRTYMSNNSRIFLNQNYEDWLENYIDKVTYCLNQLENEDDE